MPSWFPFRRANAEALFAAGGFVLGLAAGCSKVERDFGPPQGDAGNGGVAGSGAGGSSEDGGSSGGTVTGGSGPGGGSAGAPNSNCGAWAGKAGTAGAAGSSGGQGGRGGEAGGGGVAGGGGAPCALASCTNTGTPLLTVSTVEEADRFALSCGNGTAPDVAVLWTAPASGWYRLSTRGSSFDTVLGVHEPSCGGAELACSNDVGVRPDSEIVRRFALGSSALVVIDGNYGDRGTAVLNVEPVTCPATDLTGQPLPASLTTVGGTNDHTGSCGGDAEPEKTYLWTPPSDGLYRFSVASSTLRPALYLERGPQCGGELLGCNANSGTVPATVTRWLPAEQPVTLIVDSLAGSGPFTLDAVKLTDACPAVAAGGLAWDANILLDSAAPDVLSSSCGAVVEQTWMAQTNEHTYGLDVPVDCGIVVRSDWALNVYLLEGDRCDGPEMPGCQTSTCTDGACVANLSVSPGSYVLVVERTSAGEPTYSISVYCV